MSAFAVLRVKKLKSKAEIVRCDNHNTRTSVVNHASTKKHLTKHLLGNGCLFDSVEERIKSTGAKTRVDSVLALEIVLSASPEYFRPDNPGEPGTFDNARTKAWVRNTMEYARSKWGDNLVAADLHLDESTPHIHVVVVPVATKKRKKRGRDEYYEQSILDANGMFGRKALINMQTEYAHCLKPLGIRRGLRGSLAKHQDVKSFYRLVNESKSSNDEFKLDAPPLINREDWRRAQEAEVQRVLAQKNSQIEFQRRQQKAVRHSASMLDRIGGFRKVGLWFKRFSELLKKVKALSSENDRLSNRLNTMENSIEDLVEQEVDSRVAQYKNAYSKKCRQLEAMRAFEPRGLRPKGP